MKQKKSIQKKILVPICILVLAQAVILFCGIEFLGFFQKINDSAFSNLKQNVTSQGEKLEEEMVTRWSNLDVLESRINEIYDGIAKNQTITSKNLLTDAKTYNKFLDEAMPRLVSTLRTNKVNGVYIVLTGDDSFEKNKVQNYPGIYLEDQDVTSSYNQENKDLLLLRAPLSVAKKSGISTKPGWTPVFQYKAGTLVDDFITKPMKAMRQNKDMSYDLAKYWSAPFQLNGVSGSVITCSVPLVNAKGQVYGVIGISINTSYLQERVSNYDLAANNDGLYRIATINHSKVNGLWDSGSDTLSGNLGKTYQFKKENGFQKIDGVKGKTVYGYSKKLHMYENTSPFYKDEWKLIGLVPKTTLLSLTKQTTRLLIEILCFVFLTSLGGIFFIARRISKPVESLTEDVKHTKVGEDITIERTGIYELDFLSEAIENLSKEAYISAGTFTRILKMSTMKIAGFEFDKEKNRFLITNQFFDVFGKGELDGEIQTWEQFQNEMNHLEACQISKHKESGYEEIEYRFSYDHQTLWARMKTINRNDRSFGLVEDITSEKLHIQKVEYERDHDILTNLWNRRAFQRKTQELFGDGKGELKTSALMMLDLDNLKYINDNFGHDAGDSYITCMADHLKSCVDERTIISRMSGDEFYIFFYGYDNKREIRGQVFSIYEDMKQKSIDLPNGEKHIIRASAGLAWYPDDATDFAQLLLYADFAMYKVKNSVKGAFAEFNKTTYEKEAYLLQNRESLHKMISKELIDFHYQPIIDVHTGKTYGFEALIRPQIKELTQIESMLKLARIEGMMQSVETISLFKSVQIFKERSKDLKNQECKLFINSISDQKMSDEKSVEFTELNSDILHRIVIEITEVAEINDALYAKKRARIDSWGGSIALDDFGSGYNGDVALLKIAPNIVKVDIAIISGIHRDNDKRQVVKHLIEYAKERNIKVLAEGVETKEEYDTVVSLGVDYVQGFYIARPSAMPVEVEIESGCI